jgi:hypothetical protein
MPIDIPYIGNMYRVDEFKRFAELMYWRYGGWKQAQKEWRSELAKEHDVLAGIYPDDRIISQLVAKRTIELEAEYARDKIARDQRQTD